MVSPNLFSSKILWRPNPRQWSLGRTRWYLWRRVGWCSSSFAPRWSQPRFVHLEPSRHWLRGRRLLGFRRKQRSWLHRVRTGLENRHPHWALRGGKSRWRWHVDTRWSYVGYSQDCPTRSWRHRFEVSSPFLENLGWHLLMKLFPMKILLWYWEGLASHPSSLLIGGLRISIVRGCTFCLRVNYLGGA